MSNTSTIAAPTHRLLAGLIVTTIATAPAGAWALTAAATGPTDEPTTTTTTTTVATVCRNGTDPIVVADAYHGAGVSVCR